MSDSPSKKPSSVARSHLERLSHSIREKHRRVRDAIPKHVRDHFDRNFVLAMLVTVAILAQTVFISPSLAATYTTTWTTQGDFESNTAGNGGDFATTTSLTRADTTTTAGRLAMGPGGSQAFTDTFSDGNNIDYSVSTATTSGGYLANTASTTAHWTFDSTANDSSGNGFNGTLVGSPSYVAGQIGSALSLNGTTQYVTLGSPAGLDNRGPFTVSSWVRTNVIDQNQIVIALGAASCCGTETYLELFWASNNPQYLYGLGNFAAGFNSLKSAINVTANTWHHMVGTWDGTTRKLYVDGQERASGSWSGPQASYGNNAYIGAGDNGGVGGTLFSGLIDDTRIYTRALSSSEVTSLYNNDFSTTTAQSSTLATVSSGIAYAQIAATSTLNGGTVTYQLSNDNGTTWKTFTPGSNGNFGTQLNFDVTGTQLKYKISLTGNAQVDTLSIAYNGYSTTVLSNVKKDAGGDAIMTTLSWNVSRPTNTQVTFRTRGATAAQGPSALYSAQWSDVYTAANGAGSATIKANGAGGASNPTYRYIEIEATLTSDNGIAVASIDDFTLTYVINGPPNFDPTYGNSGASASVSTTEGSTWGKVQVSYSVRDTDATSGGSTPNAVTPSFEYSLNGGSSWSAISSGYLGASDLSNKTVGESAYNTYSATWDAVAQLGASTYTTTAKIRVTANDNEPVNNTATSTSANFTLDTKVPVLTFTINGSSSTSTVNISATDDTQIKDYKLSNNSTVTSDGVNGTSGALQTVGNSSLTLNTSWTLAGANSKTVYLVIRDIYGNISTTSASAPIAPANTVVKDVSIPAIDSYREFLTWTPFTTDTGVAFSKYQIYRSTDGTNYTLRTEINDSATNYYADASVASTTTYYYKVRSVDTDGDISDYGSVVSDLPDGQGGTDQIAPTLSGITVDNVRNTSARITWTTDELADSAVDYGISQIYGSVASSSSFVTDGHSVYLTGLSPSTLYYYRPKSTDISNNTGTGAAGTFTTVGGPIISNVTTENVTGSTATVVWNTDTSSDSYIDYSLSSNLSSPTSVGSTTLITVGTPYQHRVTLTGLTPATRYYYQVKSTDGSAFTTTDTNAGSYYTFVTTLDQAAPVISNIIVPVIAETSAVIVWTTDELSNSRVEFGTTENTASGSYASTTALDTTQTITHVVSLTGLTGTTDYYYRVRSADIAGNATTSAEETFTTESSGAVTITRVSGGGGGTTADKVFPTIDSMTSASTQSFDTKIILSVSEPVYALINYGETVNYGHTSGSVELLPSHTISLSNLKPGTTYYYQATVVDKAGNKTESSVGTFKTLFLAESLQTLTVLQSAQEYQSRLQEIIESALPSISPPFIEAPRITDITEDGAKITYRTNVRSYGIVSYASDEDFSRDGKYTTDISVDQEKTLNHETVLTNLRPNTKYHVVTKAFVFPEVVGTSPDIVFTTKASQLAATIVDVTTSSFRAIWKTLVPTTSVVEYTDTVTGVTQRKADGTLTTNHDVVIDNLPLNTAYTVNISGVTSEGNVIDSKQPFSVRTIVDVTPPKITELKIDSALTAGSTRSVQTIVSWKTDEPSTSVVSYEEGSGAPNSVLANKATDTQGLVHNHIVILTNLRQATIYRVQVTSTDAAGNVSALPITTIVTPKQSESIVDVIFKNFGDTFNFIK